MSHSPRQGFTLIELLVVISIIAILAGMLLPAISLVRESARKANCGSNQRQIVMSMVTYGSENDGAWPYCQGGDGAYGTVTVVGASTDQVSAIATLEFLSGWSDGELVGKLFACPTNASAKPSAPGSSLLTTGATTTAQGTIPAVQWKVQDSGYSYDPTTSSRARATRAVMADRPTDSITTNHKKVAMVVFGDGHVGNITRTQSSGATAGTNAGTICWATGTTAVAVAGTWVNSDANGDNIYDANGDDGTQAGSATSAGHGSATRCFLP